MNEHRRRLMDAPSIESRWCPFCGRPSTNRHHIVPRSAGGTDGPTVTVCGFGNAGGCHGKLHASRLHLDYRDGRWMYCETAEPTKTYTTLTDGAFSWRPLPLEETYE